MQQSRLMFFVQALANVAFGYAIAALTQVLVFSLSGLEANLAQHLEIGLIFRAVSIARSYALRQAFERLRQSRAGAVNGPRWTSISMLLGSTAP